MRYYENLILISTIQHELCFTIVKYLYLVRYLIKSKTQLLPNPKFISDTGKITQVIFHSLGNNRY